MNLLHLLIAITMLVSSSGDNANPLSANGVRLQPRDGDKILVTTRAMKRHDIILIVPSEICLLAHRGGVVRGLHGQTDQLWDEVGDLREPLTDEQVIAGRTWDVQLALALLDATTGTGLGGDVWDQYALELPRPEVVTLPFCLNSEVLLNEIQCEEMKKNALKQQQRLRDISSDVFTDHLAHPITAASVTRMGDSKSVPTPLQWAFAMVRSRCFKVAKDWFAIVPVIDMANHSFMPSARFEMFRGDQIESPSLPEESAMSISSGISDAPSASDNDIDIHEDTVFLLRATRDIELGEEVTICYDQTYTNDRLFVQYGFSLPGNPNDEIFETEDDTGTDAVTASLPSSTADNFRTPEEEHSSSTASAMELLLKAADIISKSYSDSKVDQETSNSLQVHAASKSLLRRLSSPSRLKKTGQLSAISMLHSLLVEVEDMIASYPTTHSEDTEILQALSTRREEPLVVMTGTTIKQHTSQQKTEYGSDLNVKDGEGSEVPLNRYQLSACVRHRIERKKLLLCGQNMLKVAIAQTQTDA